MQCFVDDSYGSFLFLQPLCLLCFPVLATSPSGLLDMSDLPFGAEASHIHLVRHLLPPWTAANPDCARPAMPQYPKGQGEFALWLLYYEFAVLVVCCICSVTPVVCPAGLVPAFRSLVPTTDQADVAVQTAMQCRGHKEAET